MSKPKYRNAKVTQDGISHDSRKELKRWNELLLLQMAGEISKLERQKTFVLAKSVKFHDAPRAKPELRYICDFFYYDHRKGDYVIEDVKSPATAKDKAFVIKRHLMKSIYNFDVVII